MTDVFTLSESDNILITKTAIKKLIQDKYILRGQSSPTLDNDIVIAGGFFATMLKLDPYNDIDVFILNNNRVMYDHLTYKNDHDPAGDVWEIRNDKKYMNGNPHVLGVTTNKNTKVQYILTDHKSRKELLEDFDFVHCTASYVPFEDKLYITREAYDCIVKKELRHNKPGRIPAEWRREKFEKRGWMYQVHVDDIIQSKSRIQTILDEVLMDDILKNHGNPDAVLAYQNR